MVSRFQLKYALEKLSTYLKSVNQRGSPTSQFIHRIQLIEIWPIHRKFSWIVRAKENLENKRFTKNCYQTFFRSLSTWCLILLFVLFLNFVFKTFILILTIESLYSLFAKASWRNTRYNYKIRCKMLLRHLTRDMFDNSKFERQ